LQKKKLKGPAVIFETFENKRLIINKVHKEAKLRRKQVDALSHRGKGTK